MSGYLLRGAENTFPCASGTGRPSGPESGMHHGTWGDVIEELTADHREVDELFETC
ncbi:hypothetical protein [Streptomyces sp. NPDC005498]|uniref:hypothetical protein n=1 Tax=Streptomyces sp. NPDC005498 TaxID=3364717 RepID=UPI0036A013EA